MGYLLAETDNMFYNMLFHLINNALPTLLLQLTSSVASEQMESAEAMASTGIFACDGGGVFYVCFGRTVSDLCGELPDP